MLQKHIFAGVNGKTVFLNELAVIARGGGGTISKAELIHALSALRIAADGFTQAGRILGVHAEIVRAAIVRRQIFPALVAALNLEENERTYSVAKSKVR